MRSSHRSRPKARKPRYVSLRRHLAPPPPPPPPPDPSDMSSSSGAVAVDEDEEVGRRGDHRLDLFPLHPEHLDRDPHVACLLEDRAGELGVPTLAAILGGGGGGVPESSGSPSPASLASPSVNWEEEEGGGAREDGLARRALRGRERWAYCSSSSAPAPQAAASSEEEVASSAGGDLWSRASATRALALKLDYEEILAAWSDRGPLYLDGDAPQVVPQLLHHADPFDSAAIFPVLVEVGQGGGGANAWKVPEEAWGGGDGNGADAKEEENGGGGGELSREARVKRYKEKRSNRLFAKRIRYEVRKMNAEKRPRVKGRFVRRSEEEQEEHS